MPPAGSTGYSMEAPKFSIVLSGYPEFCHSSTVYANSLAQVKRLHQLRAGLASSRWTTTPKSSWSPCAELNRVSYVRSVGPGSTWTGAVPPAGIEPAETALGKRLPSIGTAAR